MLIHFLAAVAQDAAEAAVQAVPVKEEISFSLIDMAFKGGVDYDSPSYFICNYSLYFWRKMVGNQKSFAN